MLSRLTYKKVYTSKEVMEIAKISRPTFYRHVKQGLIKTSKIGNLLRISEEDLDKYLKGE